MRDQDWDLSSGDHAFEESDQLVLALDSFLDDHAFEV
jgi:hypothetical protein